MNSRLPRKITARRLTTHPLASSHSRPPPIGKVYKILLKKATQKKTDKLKNLSVSTYTSSRRYVQPPRLTTSPTKVGAVKIGQFQTEMTKGKGNGNKPCPPTKTTVAPVGGNAGPANAVPNNPSTESSLRCGNRIDKSRSKKMHRGEKIKNKNNKRT